MVLPGCELYSRVVDRMGLSKIVKMIKKQKENGLQNFRDFRYLGRGHYGHVFGAFRKSDNIEYALKEIPLFQLRPQQRQEALNEIRLLASTDSPDVISFYDSFTFDGYLYIVMELAQTDLHHVLRRYRKRDEWVSEERIWTIFMQVCLAVKHLHDAKVLHRDIKSANVLLMNSRTAKLGDLGVSTPMRASHEVDQIGTPCSMSPEMWNRRPYNESADIWALGVLLYEMAALKLPFQGIDEASLRKSIMSGKYLPIPIHYSIDLRDLVTKLLVPNPHDRPTIDKILSHHIPLEIHNTLAASREVHDPDFSTRRSGVFTMHTEINMPKEMNKLQKTLPLARYPDRTLAMHSDLHEAATASTKRLSSFGSMGSVGSACLKKTSSSPSSNRDVNGATRNFSVYQTADTRKAESTNSKPCDEPRRVVLKDKIDGVDELCQGVREALKKAELDQVHAPNNSVEEEGKESYQTMRELRL